MSRPFKVNRIEKKENLEGDEQPERIEIKQQNGGRETVRRPVLPIKKKINIINSDALKNSEDNAKDKEHKISLGSKPNLFKGKREANRLLGPNRESAHIEAGEPEYGEAPRPTPQIVKKRGQFDFRRRDRENIVIQEDDPSGNLQPDESHDLDVQDSTNLLRKPDLKIKRLTPRRQFTQRQQIQGESTELDRSSENPTFHLTPANFEYREINIQPVDGISEGKIDKQKKRSHELTRILNLEVDIYEQTLSIGNVTPYEIYINKIKGGFLKNSLDQAYDETAANSCQTLSFEYADFTNQCPQDYSMDVNRIEKLDAEHLFDNFIIKMAPVIEQLIQPTNLITDPPIFLLAFRPTFKTFLKCPYPIFIYHSEQFGLDLIVVGQKLYIAEGEIESVLMIGKNIIAGLKTGQLILWNGQNSKTSRLYNQIKEFTNTTNFELPSYCNHHLDKYSPYVSQYSIVDLLHEGGMEFVSLDSTGKIVKWVVEDEQNQSHGQVIRGVSVTQLRHMVQRPALKGYKIKKRSESLYISTSMGIIILSNKEIRQRLQSPNQQIIEFQIPKRSPLVYCLTKNSLKIYNEQYSHPLMSMDFEIAPEHLSQIIIPQIEHDNREVIILSVLYLTDSAGGIYEVKLLENQFQFVRKVGQDEDSDARRDRNVIFRGVNRSGQTLQTLKLMRDLKMTKQSTRMGANTCKTVANLKSIISSNRELIALLQHQNSMMV